MQDILTYFADAKDPLLESSRLLEQSQAQFVSALRQDLHPFFTAVRFILITSVAMSFHPCTILQI